MKTLYIVIILVIVLALVFFLLKKKKSKAAPTEGTIEESAPEKEAPAETSETEEKSEV